VSVVALDRTKTYFEQFVAAVPEPLQGFTRGVLTPFEEVLELVAGDPDELLTAAQLFLDTAGRVGALADQQFAQRQALAAPVWGGPAAEAFQQAMDELEQQLRDLGRLLDAGREVLQEASNTAVDAFNLLLELIFEFLVAFFIEAIIAAAAAALSFGASVAAFAVRWLARFAVTLGRALRIVRKLAAVLNKLARKLDDVARMLTAYRKRVMELKALKKQHRIWSANGRSAAGRAFWQEYATKVVAPKMAFNFASPVNLPGKFGAGLDTVMGVHDISDGTKDRNYVKDGTYREDLGPYTRGVQDLLDAAG
jgi:WXG100 family type VII secretion target